MRHSRKKYQKRRSSQAVNNRIKVSRKQYQKGGYDSLVYASQSGDLNTMQSLLQRGADVNETGNSGYTALMTACAFKKVDIVNFLVRQPKINLEAAEIGGPTDGFTALMIACKAGSYEIVDILLRSGANVNVRSTDGHTPLSLTREMEAATRDRKFSQIAEYLEYAERMAPQATAVNINAVDENGNTALLLACANGELEKVKSLVGQNANVNFRRENDGATPLLMASRNGYLEIVKILVDRGANMNVGGKKGDLALAYASWKGHLEIVKYLVEKAATVDAKNIKGKTALMFAAEGGHLAIVKYLVENPKQKADVDAKSTNGKTALDRAIEKGYTEIVAYLEGLKVQPPPPTPTPPPPPPPPTPQPQPQPQPEPIKFQPLVNIKTNAPNQDIDVQFVEKNSNGNYIFVVATADGKKGKFIAHTKPGSKINSNTNEYGITGAFNVNSGKQSGGKKTRRNKASKNRSLTNKLPKNRLRKY